MSPHPTDLTAGVGAVFNARTLTTGVAGMALIFGVGVGIIGATTVDSSANPGTSVAAPGSHQQGAETTGATVPAAAGQRQIRTTPASRDAERPALFTSTAPEPPHDSVSGQTRPDGAITRRARALTEAREAARRAARELERAKAARVKAERHARRAKQAKARAAAAKAKRAKAHAKVMPMTRYRIASRFGATGSWARYHTGTDFAAPMGTPIRAIAAGVVTYAGAGGPAGGWAGSYVVIKHADGYSTLYAHMSPTLSVAPGQRVSAGERLGRVGMTGRTFGAHSHIELYPPSAIPGDIYRAVNLFGWLKPNGGS